MAKDEIIVEQPEGRTTKAKPKGRSQAQADEIEQPSAEIAAESQVEGDAEKLPPADPFPNRRKYLDGYVLNMPMSYWEQRTEEEIRQQFKDRGMKDGDVDARVSLILEAAAFHEVTIGTAELVEARQAEEHEAHVATRKAIDAASQGMET